MLTLTRRNLVQKSLPSEPAHVPRHLGLPHRRSLQRLHPAAAKVYGLPFGMTRLYQDRVGDPARRWLKRTFGSAGPGLQKAKRSICCIATCNGCIGDVPEPADSLQVKHSRRISSSGSDCWKIWSARLHCISLGITVSQWSIVPFV